MKETRWPKNPRHRTVPRRRRRLHHPDASAQGRDDARRTVEYWISEGVTSFKAYTEFFPEKKHGECPDDETCSRSSIAESGGSRIDETDRAEMASDLDAVRVAAFTAAASFVSVMFMYALNEVTPSLIQYSTVRRASSRVLELMHLDGEGAGAFEVRSGDVDFWASEFSFIDGAFEFEVGVRLDAAGGADGGDAAGEIEEREAGGVFGIERERAPGEG